MNQNNHITTVIENGILRIGINRPQKKNALNKDMYDGIRHALTDADENPEIKVVLIHGGSTVFSAGGDLKRFDQFDMENPSPGRKFIFALQAFKKPVIASVNGIAIGIGTTLLLHCDLVYAAEDARFRLPFVNLGACPEAGSSLLLPASAGMKKVTEVLMLADFFNTATAIELGIVNEAIEPGNVFDHAMEKAVMLTQKPQQALITTKQLLKQETNQAVKDRIKQESALFGELLLTPESIDARTRLKNKIKSSKDV